MAIVAHGFGTPEAGALVVLGLGATEADQNAIAAHLTGSASLSATLTVSSADAEQPAAGYEWRPLTRPVPPRIPWPITARLTGGSALAADLVGVFDFDGELEQLLLAGVL